MINITDEKTVEKKVRAASHEIFVLLRENASRPLDVFRDERKLRAFLENASVIESACLDGGEEGFHCALEAYIALGLDGLLPLDSLPPELVDSGFCGEPRWDEVVVPRPKPRRKSAAADGYSGGSGGGMQGKTLWEYQRGRRGRGDMQNGGTPLYNTDELKALVVEHFGTYRALSERTHIPIGTIKTMFHLQTHGPAYRHVVECLIEDGILART